MAWDLNKIGDEIQTYLRSHYPGLGCVFIIVDTATSKEELEQCAKDNKSAVSMTSYSNYENGTTCAILSSVLASRIKDIKAYEDALKNLGSQVVGRA